MNNRIKNDIDHHNGNTKYKGTKDIRYLFNEDEDEYGYEDIRYLLNDNEDEDEDKNKESPFRSIIADIRNKPSKSGDKLIKKGFYYVEKMKELTESQVNNIKDKLIKFKNDLIMKNKVNNKLKKILIIAMEILNTKALKILDIHLMKGILMILNICQ